MSAYYRINANGFDPCVVTKQDFDPGGWQLGIDLPSGFMRVEVNRWNEMFPLYRIPVPAQCKLPGVDKPTTGQPPVSRPPVVTGPGKSTPITGDKCAPALPPRTDENIIGLKTKQHLEQPLTFSLLGWRVGAGKAGASSEPPLTGLGEFTVPHRVETDADGNIRTADLGKGPGGLAFAPPEFNEFMLRGDGVHPKGTWPDRISRAAFTILAGAGHSDDAGNVLAFGLPSARSYRPQSGWFFELDTSTGKLWARKTDANCNVVASYDMESIGGSGLGDPGGNGIVVRTALNTTTNRTIALAVDGALAVSNGDGVAGNPTIGIDIPSLPAPTGAIDDNDDYVVIWSDADAAHRKIPLSDLPAGSGTGDVSGPGIGNSTVGAIPTWGTTDGDELTDSVVIMDPVTGDVAGVNDFATTGATALGTVTPAQITGNQLAYTGLAPGTTAILDGDAEHRIQSIEAPANDGQIHTVYNDGLYNIIFENESPSETGSDSRKINTGTGTDFVLAPGTQATLFWSAATNRWHIKGCADRIPSHTPGAPSHNAPGGSLAFRTDNGRAYLQTSSAVSNNWFALAFDGDFQPLNSNLTALAGLASAADRLPYFTGSGTASLAVFTAAGRNLLDDADATTMLSTLGLSDNGKSLVTAANYAAMRGLLDLEAGTDFPSLSTFNSHNTRHQAGEDDAIKLDDLAAPDDNTDLNASTSAHGLLRKLSNTATEFLNGQGDWATPNVNVRKNSTGSVHARPRINFIEGSNVTLTVADDGTDNEIDVTIAASASGGGLPDPGANGIVVRNSATPTTVNRSIAANTADSAKGIVVSDGDGVAGDPTIGLNITSLATETVIGGDDYFPYAKYTGSYANSKIKLVDIARAASRAQQARLAGNLASTGTTPINSNLSFDLVTGRSYRFRCVLFYTHTNSGGSVGARFDFNGSATFSSAIVGGYFSSSLNANVQRISSAGYNTSLATDINTTAASGTVTGVMVLEGSCACNGSGTLVLRHGRTAGGSHTSSLLAGSTMEVYEVLDA